MSSEKHSLSFIPQASYLAAGSRRHRRKIRHLEEFRCTFDLYIMTIQLFASRYSHVQLFFFFPTPHPQNSDFHFQILAPQTMDHLSKDVCTPLVSRSSVGQGAQRIADAAGTRPSVHIGGEKPGLGVTHKASEIRRLVSGSVSGT